MEDSIEFKMKDGKYGIVTNQLLEEEEFVQRSIRTIMRKTNFEMQVDFAKHEIATHTDNIQKLSEGIIAIQPDIDKVKHFLESNHRGDLWARIEAEVKRQQDALTKQISDQRTEAEGMQPVNQ